MLYSRWNYTFSSSHYHFLYSFYLKMTNFAKCPFKLPLNIFVCHHPASSTPHPFLSFVHCFCELLCPLLFPGRYYLHLKEPCLLHCIRPAPACCCIISSHSHSSTSFCQSYSLCYISPPLSVFSFASCPAASESVLLRQLFQSKLTQTGSLLRTGQTGLRGPKAALLLYKMPPASLVTASTIASKPQRRLELSKV